MRKKIDEYLNKISKISLDVINYEYIYKELICYDNGNLNECIKDILRVFTDLLDNNKKYIKIVDDSILITNIEDDDTSKRRVRLGIFNKLEYITFNVENLIGFCNKKKIRFSGKLECYDNIGYLELEIKDIDESLRVIDYVNSKLGNYIYSVNPLFFSVDNVMVSLNGEYSYIEILSMYLYKFIFKMKELNMNIDYNNFKDFMLDNYLRIDNQIDMNKYLDFNFKEIKLSTFFSNLNECTNIILYLFNGNEFEEFRDYYRKLNRKNSKISNKYSIFDNLDDCRDLFSELVTSMISNYGEDYARENIIKYRDTGKGDYITRKDNLRRRVMACKNFIIFLMKIDLNWEIDKVIDKYVFERKKKILENICREVFLTYLDDENRNYSKIQVARSLIRIGYGDYSTITRNNDARKNAIDNIEPSEVVKLIKNSLSIEHVKKEEELYELYAEYIENLCIN